MQSNTDLAGSSVLPQNLASNANAKSAPQLVASSAENSATNSVSGEF